MLISLSPYAESLIFVCLILFKGTVVDTYKMFNYLIDVQLALSRKNISMT